MCFSKLEFLIRIFQAIQPCESCRKIQLKYKSLKLSRLNFGTFSVCTRSNRVVVCVSRRQRPFLATRDFSSLVFSLQDHFPYERYQKSVEGTKFLNSKFIPQSWVETPPACFRDLHHGDSTYRVFFFSWRHRLALQVVA